MIPLGLTFTRPEGLLLIVPWILFGLFFRHRQLAAWQRARALVSPRFLPQLTVHHRASLERHVGLILLLGALLLLSASGPRVPGDVEVSSDRHQVLLLLDASASMRATDVTAIVEAEAPEHRFGLSQQIAHALVDRLEEHHFALATFSGVATINLPMTTDREVLREAIESAETHTYYQNSGSALGSALELSLHFAAEQTVDLQVVVLSDGERSDGDHPHDELLDALAARDVPVHSIAVGSLAGQAREIYDFNDVVAGREEKTVLSEHTTRRVDRHLRDLTLATRGRFSVASPRAIDSLVTTISNRPRSTGRLLHESSWRDVSRVPLWLFALGFVYELLILGRGQGRETRSFDVRYLGDSEGEGEVLGVTRRRQGHLGRGVVVGTTGACLLLLLVSCNSRQRQAHAANEAGIGMDLVGQHGTAQPLYERSRAFGYRAHVPAFNQARSLSRAGRHAAAHELFQEVLETAPELAEAHYNDGHALFGWGEDERDEIGCELDRTLELWEHALFRFEQAAERTANQDLREDANQNALHLVSLLEHLEGLRADPPAECLAHNPLSSAASDGSSSQADPDPSPSSSESESELDPPAGGEPEPVGASPVPSQAPPSSGGGGLSPEQLSDIEETLQRLAASRGQEGRYHRRTRQEQFPPESWKHPETKLLW